MKKNNTIFLVMFLIIIFLSFSCNIFNSILWAIASALIIFSGIYFTIKTNFKQFRFKKMIRLLMQKDKNNTGISTISSLMMSLGGRIGVGSLSGVALSIYEGGIGSIFWIWIISLIISINTYVESFLGVAYQEKDEKNIYKGGVSYYIKKGLNYKILAIIYALILIICYVGGYLTIQTNTIVKVTSDINFINPYLVTIVISLIMAIVIFGGTKKIASFTNKIVTIMGIIYLGVGMYIIFKNINDVVVILSNIIKSAFNFKSFFGGFLYTLVIAIQRSIFITETALGTTAISSAMTNDKEEKQGLIQVFGIHITTLIVCTITALIIILSDYNSLTINDINGIEITKYAFNYHLGNFGNTYLILIVVLFSYSTIISGYYYAEVCLKYLLPNITNKHLNIFKIIVIIITSLGGLISSSLLWSFSDIGTAILITINIASIYLLRKDIINNKT